MRIDRRRFLMGTGGAVLALPFLESLVPRAAAQVSPPRRFVLMFHAHGLVRTKWMPASTGALPATGDISEILAPLNAMRDQILVLSGLGNPARHVVEGDNHRRTNTTVLTNARPQDDSLAGGASVDQLAAQLLGSSTPRSSVLLPLSASDSGPSYFFSRSSGGVISHVSRFSHNPRDAAQSLFGSLPSDEEPPPTPTLRERLEGRRASILGSAGRNLSALRARLHAADRDRLDAHAEHLERLETRFGNGGGVPSVACTQPVYSDIPSYSYEGLGRYDNLTAPAQIDNLVRAFVCDLTRVGTLYFNESQGPTFPWLYGGDTTAAWRGQDGREYIDWHDLIHLGQPTGASSDSGVPNLVRGDRFYASMFARLVETLAATPDVDGASSMLDNTLCLWMTDFGHENHGTHNIPAVMAGLGTSYQKGRHLNVDGYTVGDLFATVLHLLGAPDTVRVGLEGPIDWSSLSETWAWSGSSTELFQRGLLPL